MNPSPPPGPPAASPDAPLADSPDPPTARTRALRDSMRMHESAARGSATVLAWTVAVIVACALGLVVFMLWRRG
ncbi:MAG: hypothetical protein JNM26_08550 [Ideonella sp.]|nr:hypothetical protein [Ideonella sp.]